MHRLELWGTAATVFLANPTLGIGFEGFVKQHDAATHNTFTQLLVSVGFFRFLPFLILLVKTLNIGVGNLKTRPGGALFVGLVGIFTAAQFILFYKNRRNTPPFRAGM